MLRASCLCSHRDASSAIAPMFSCGTSTQSAAECAAAIVRKFNGKAKATMFAMVNRSCAGKHNAVKHSASYGRPLAGTGLGFLVMVTK
jgi:hypothetical protein